MRKIILGGLGLIVAACSLLLFVNLPPKLNVPNTCVFSDLPEGFVVRGVGSYAGSTRVWTQIDETDKTTGIDVHVTETGAPILLVLSAHDPVLWSVHVSAQSRVVGALVTGYHRQAVRGLPDTIPLAVSTLRGRECAFYAYAHDANEDLAKLMKLVQASTNKRLETFQTASKARDFVIGPGAGTKGIPLSSTRRARGDDPLWRPHRGHPALDAMVTEGTLRRPSQQEIDAWVDGATDARGFGHLGVKVSHRMAPNRTYIVDRPVTLPTDLAPGYGIALLVAADVHLGEINFGRFNRVLIYRMRDFTCTGAPECR
jgi:hypothetical protein